MRLREARVYTLRYSIADQKVYRLYGSRRVEDVSYPGVSPNWRLPGPELSSLETSIGE